MIADFIVQTKKFAECDLNDILEMIDYNIKLVWLNENTIPDTIIQFMNQQEYKRINISYLRSNYKVLVKDNNSIQQIFEGI
jgi:hypothetical protein